MRTKLTRGFVLSNNTNGSRAIADFCADPHKLYFINFAEYSYAWILLEDNKVKVRQIYENEVLITGRAEDSIKPS